MLAPKSQRAFSMWSSLMTPGMVKRPWSFNFSGMLHSFIIYQLTLLGDHLLHKFCVVRHLLKGIRKRDIYMNLLEDVSKLGKLIIKSLLLESLWQWQWRCDAGWVVWKGDRTRPYLRSLLLHLCFFFNHLFFVMIFTPYNLIFLSSCFELTPPQVPCYFSA